MTAKTIYSGRFVSTPTPHDLLIRTGAVLVDRNDGKGVIEKVAWDVNSPDGARVKFDAGNEIEVVVAKDNVFFFPGFIGTSDIRMWKNLRRWHWTGPLQDVHLECC
jgi:hypothetical protein